MGGGRWGAGSQIVCDRERKIQDLKPRWALKFSEACFFSEMECVNSLPGKYVHVQCLCVCVCGTESGMRRSDEGGGAR